MEKVDGLEIRVKVFSPKAETDLLSFGFSFDTSLSEYVLMWPAMIKNQKNFLFLFFLIYTKQVSNRLHCIEKLFLNEKYAL